MPEITIYEGDDSKADFTLMYGSNWSDSTKIGYPVAKTDTSRVYFYVKTLLADTNAWLTLTDASSAQINWTDATNGKIRVIFGSSTSGHAGSGQHYELRIKMADGTYLTAEAGAFNVLESVVDNP